MPSSSAASGQHGYRLTRAPGRRHVPAHRAHRGGGDVHQASPAAHHDHTRAATSRLDGRRPAPVARRRSRCCSCGETISVAFMAGAFVFPGGRVDAADHRVGRAEPAVPREPALIRRPERRGRSGLSPRGRARAAGRSRGLGRSLDDLIPIAHWVTPEIEIRRYDTRFFLTMLPPGQEARHDEGETTETRLVHSHRRARAQPGRRDHAAAADVDHAAPARAPPTLDAGAPLGANDAGRPHPTHLREGRRRPRAHASRRSDVPDDRRMGGAAVRRASCWRRAAVGCQSGGDRADRRADRALQPAEAWTCRTGCSTAARSSC